MLCGVVVGIQRLTSNSGSTVAAASTGTTPATVAPSAAPTATATENAGPTTGADVGLGVFRGTSAAEVAQFGSWLGRSPEYAVDFSSRSTWDEISNPAYMINHWRGSKYRMVYSVAILPFGDSVSIKAGARGDYDEYYRRLARNLVAGGQEDAILRLGWEFNLKGWRWSTDNPDEFISYWRHIVTAMRSVDGQELEFDWNPVIGETAYDATLYYPGGKYVDYVGVDVYDISWSDNTYPYGKGCSAECKKARQTLVWDQIYTGRLGLMDWAAFAKKKGKPLSIPEWGAWDRTDGRGGGDNAYFIKQMHAFIDDPHNNVAYQAYFDIDVNNGEHRLSVLKKAGKAYRSLFK